LARAPIGAPPCPVARHASAPLRPERWNAIPVLEQQPELGDEAEHARTQTVSDPQA